MWPPQNYGGGVRFEMDQGKQASGGGRRRHRAGRARLPASCAPAPGLRATRGGVLPSGAPCPNWQQDRTINCARSPAPGRCRGGGNAALIQPDRSRRSRVGRFQFRNVQSFPPPECSGRGLARSCVRGAPVMGGDGQGGGAGSPVRPDRETAPPGSRSTTVATSSVRPGVRCGRPHVQDVAQVPARRSRSSRSGGSSSGPASHRSSPSWR